jgi:hypothetical protein
MFFDIVISIHIKSQLNIFCFINNVSSKMEFFAVSEIGGAQFHAKPQFHAHLSDEQEFRFVFSFLAFLRSPCAPLTFMTAICSPVDFARPRYTRWHAPLRCGLSSCISASAL